ncbi:hypothetical protein SMD22_07700 [Brevibacillus halotolerans]|nr:hypothetical protein SMD22_07700 [Brevibacillus halotolerans]
MSFDSQFEKDVISCRNVFIDSLKGRKDVFVQEVRRITESDTDASTKLYGIEALIRAFDSFEKKDAEVIPLKPRGGQ